MGSVENNRDCREQSPRKPLFDRGAGCSRKALSRRSFLGLAGVATAGIAFQSPTFLLRAWADDGVLAASGANSLPQMMSEDMVEEVSDTFNPSLADTSWKGTGSKATPYLIETASHLYGLALLVSSEGNEATFACKHFAQTASIDLASFNWIPIGNKKTKQVFCGEYDGRGNTVSNMRVGGSRTDVEAHVAGLFGSLGKGACVRNVLLEGAEIHTLSKGLKVYASYAGGIAGFVDAGALLENCGSSNARIDVQVKPASNDAQLGEVLVGGIAGCNKGSVKGCYCENSEVRLNYAYEGSQNKELVGNAGGLVGKSEETIKNSYVRSVGVSSRCAHVGYQSVAGVGGIVGASAKALTANCYVANLDTSQSSAKEAKVDGQDYSSSSEGSLFVGYLSGRFDAASTLSDAYFDESLGVSEPAVGESNGSLENVIQYTGAGVGTLKQQSRFGSTHDLLETLNAWVGDQQDPPWCAWLRESGGFPTFAKLLPQDFWGTLTFPVTTADGTTPFYFDESMFEGSSFVYDSHLSTLSLCLAMSGFASNDVDYPEKSRNAKKFLSDIGMHDVEVNEWFTKKPTQHSIGVAVGHRPVEADGASYELVAVAVRGAGYELEWCSNVTVGKTADHEGFDEAARNVVDFLKSYLGRHKSDMNASGLKLWVSGFSRAAATSNLVGARLNKASRSTGNEVLGKDLSLAVGDGYFSLNQCDAYVYCMEAPAGAYLPDDAARQSALADHGNIHNIINPCDLVPRVAPNALKFGRYGIDLMLPAPAQGKTYQEKRDAMLVLFYDIKNENTKEYVLDKAWEFGCGTLDVFLSVFFDKLTREQLKTRENYAENFQAAFVDVLTFMMGTVSLPLGKWVEILRRACTLANPVQYGKALWNDVFLHDDWVETPVLFAKWLIQAIKDSGYDISEHEKQITHLLRDVVGLVGKFAYHHPVYFSTFLMNVAGGFIFPAHYAELCLAWLRAMDSNYIDGPIEFSGDGAVEASTYRVLHINGAVDVAVEVDDGKVVDVFEGDVARSPEECGFVAFLNPDGEKLVYIPAIGSCNVLVTARDDSAYSIVAIDCNAKLDDASKVTSYFDVPISKGERNCLELPLEQDCMLKSSNGLTEYPISFMESGSEKIKETCTFFVDPQANDPKLGMIWGGGLRLKGTYALLKAEPFEGSRFVEWRMGDVRVSENVEYRFRVEHDAAPVAYFSKLGDPNPPTPGPKPLVPTGDVSAKNAAAAVAIGVVAAGAVATAAKKAEK